MKPVPCETRWQGRWAPLLLGVVLPVVVAAAIAVYLTP